MVNRSSFIKIVISMRNISQTSSSLRDLEQPKIHSQLRVFVTIASWGWGCQCMSTIASHAFCSFVECFRGLPQSFLMR